MFFNITGLIKIGILLAIIIIIRRFIRERKGQASSKKSSIMIIEERYARGEITREQYLKLKADLEDK